MKALISIAIAIAVLWGLNELIAFWQKKRREAEGIQVQEAARPAALRGEDLPGLPPTFEASLQEASGKGAASLKHWLDTYRRFVQDPRLAWIELDYVVLVSRDNPQEAKQVFRAVKARVRPDSPVYERVKKLERTYE
jgi:hypothetical protein